MRAIILISAVFLCDALNRQRGATKGTEKNQEYAATVFWIAIVYAVILDLNE